eukprot:GFUD01021535.1.p1 GENE.GFUD01021535.1~~GFUD01021535.1.p1  ORF type:complete len:109 (+),score=16.43 GFUD01021535.1:74-400(+)
MDLSQAGSVVDQKNYENEYPYNFTGLQIYYMENEAEVWNSQEDFKHQVIFKLYMFIPAMIAGILLGIILWIIIMLILRTFKLVKTCTVTNNKDTQDLETGSSYLYQGT